MWLVKNRSCNGIELVIFFIKSSESEFQALNFNYLVNIYTTNKQEIVVTQNFLFGCLN